MAIRIQRPAASGDTLGPASSNDNAVARFDGTTGKLLKDSPNLLFDGVKLSMPVDAVTSHIELGASADLSLDHDGIDSHIINITGELILQNKDVTADVLVKLGTTTSATTFTVLDSSDNTLTSTRGDGKMLVTGPVEVGTAIPTASALLSMHSTTQGFLAPKMTTTQRDAISSPVSGLEIYNTTTNEPEYFNGTVWGSIISAGEGVVDSVSGSTNINITGTAVDPIVNLDDIIEGTGSNGALVMRGSANSPTGGIVQISGGGASTTGGTVTIVGGFGGASGGDANLLGGDGTSGFAGDATIRGGNGDEQVPGGVVFVGGGNAGFNGGGGGDVTITSGNAEGPGEDSGAITLDAGTSIGGAGAGIGDILLARTDGSVGIGTGSVVASALLELFSTTQGFKPPSMTTTQRDAITSPATGLEIFNTTTAQPEFFDGSAWSVVGLVNKVIGGTNINITGTASEPTVNLDDTILFADGSTQDTGSTPDGIGWHPSTISPTLQTSSLNTQDNAPLAIWVRADGLKLYMTGNQTADIFEYNMTTPWDVSTLAFLATKAVNHGAPRGLFFKPDGTKFYVGRFTGFVLEHTMSIPWDVTSAGTSTGTLGGAGGIQSMSFKADGTAVYINDGNTQLIRQFDMSVPWDIDTATDPAITFDYTIEGGGASAITFRSDGRSMYVGNSTTLFEYELTTPWDITTASLIDSGTVVNGEFLFSPDGTKAIGLDQGTDLVHGFDVGVVTGTSIIKKVSDNVATNVVSALLNVDTTPSNWSELKLSTHSSVGSEVTGALLGAQFLDHTDASIDADFVIKTTHNNILSERLRIADGLISVVTGALSVGTGNIVSPDGASGVPINIISGVGSAGNGGDIDLEAGGGSGAGGSASLIAGDGTFAGGALNINSGNVAGTGIAGTISLQAGISGGASAGGQVHLFGGIGGDANGTGGQVLVHAGGGGNSQGDGGLLSLEGGQGFASGNTDGGDVDIQGGQNFGTGVHGDVLLQTGGGSVGIGSNPIASALLNVASVTQGFMQPRLTETQRDAIGSPATGLSVFNSTTDRPNYHDGTAWRGLASSGTASVEVWEEADFGTVNVGVNIDAIPNATFVLMAPITQTLPIDIATGASFQLLTTNRAVNILTYTNVTEAQFRGVNIGTFAVFDVVTNGNGTGTLVDIDGGVVSWKFPDFNGYSSGGVLRNLISVFAPGVLFEFINSGLQIIDCQTSTIVGCLVLAFDGNALNGFELKGGNSGHFQLYENVLEADDQATLFRIDPGFAGTSTGRIGVTGSEVVNPNGVLFNVSGGTTGAFSGVTDAAVALTTIDTVSDSSGVARFNFTVGPTLFVNQQVAISNFVTQTNYNTTGIITAVGAGFFEVGSIAFTANDTTGDFSSDSITLIEISTAAVDGDTLVIDTLNGVQYDGAATVYNKLTNQFQINRTFSISRAGTWDTSGIDQTDPRVLADNNPGFPNSRAIAYAVVNDDTQSATAIADGTYAAIDVTGIAENGSQSTQRFKVVDPISGIFEYIGIEPFDGLLTASIWALKTGATANYRFAQSINGAVPVFATANYSPMEVKTVKVSVTGLAPVSLVLGDTVQIMAAGDGTADDITITDLQISIQ